jgi:hypothetical protein
MNYNIFKEILKVIKGLKGGTMIYVFIVSISCFLLDFFYLRYFVNGYSLLLDIFRSIYLITGFFSHIFVVDKIIGKIEDWQKQKKQKKELEERYNQKVATIYNLAKPVLDTIPSNQLSLLKKFVDNEALQITLPSFDVEHPHDQPVYLANYIMAETYELGLIILIASTSTHTILTIDEFFYDVLCEYFENL